MHPELARAVEEVGQASSPDAQNLLRSREILLQNQRHNDLLAVLSTIEGRRFVWGLLEDAGVFGPSFAADPLATAYNEGRRAVGLGLMVRCQTEATEQYTLALQESLAAQKADAEMRKAAQAVAQPKEEETELDG